MKHIVFYALLTSVFAIISCNKNDDKNLMVQPPKEYIVSIGCGGEIIDVTIGDLTKSDDKNDIYAIQVYSKIAEGNGTYSAYAHGLFTTLEGVSIKLFEGYKYKFVASLIKEGAEKLAHPGGNYYNPFTLSKVGDSPRVGTSFIYATDSYFNGIAAGGTQLQGVSGVFHRPNLDRYYGELSDYIPTENGNVVLELKRTSFGLKVLVEEMEEGSLSIQMSGAPLFIINHPDTVFEDVFTFNSVSSAWASESYKETAAITFSWTKADGVVVPITTREFDFYRNKRTTITVKIEDNGIDNGIGTSQEMASMGEGENYSI